MPDRRASGDKPAVEGSDSSAAYWHGDYVYVSDYGRGIDVIKYNGEVAGKSEKKVCWNSCEK